MIQQGMLTCELSRLSHGTQCAFERRCDWVMIFSGKTINKGPKNRDWGDLEVQSMVSQDETMLGHKSDHKVV